jgi:hypothetical protein
MKHIAAISLTSFLLACMSISLNAAPHYNPTLNKCFMLEVSEAYQKDRPTGFGKLPFVCTPCFCRNAPSRFSQKRILLDVNANREYGEFFGDLRFSKPSGLPPTCYLGQKFCRSESEWDAMANVYMEEDGTGDLPQITGGPVTGR